MKVILSDGQAKLAQLEQEIQLQIETIEDEARVAAKAALQDARRKGTGSLLPERARRLHEARLQALRIVAEARRDVANRLSFEAKQLLAELRDRPELSAKAETTSSARQFKILIGQESLSSALRPSEHLLLEVDARDELRLRSIVSELGITAAVQPVLDSWGGVIASTADGRIRVDNTLGNAPCFDWTSSFMASSRKSLRVSEFAYANARLRAMKSRLLSPQALSDLANAPDVASMLNSLIRTPYRASIELALVSHRALAALRQGVQHEFYGRLSLAHSFFPRQFSRACASCFAAF